MKSIILSLSLLLLFVACNNEDSNTPLHNHTPVTQEVIANGYTVNPVTGKEILPVVNSLGDTVQTGVPIPTIGKAIHLDSIKAPVAVPLNGQPKVVPTNTNVHEAGIPKVVEAKPYTPNLDSLLFVLVNSIGDTVPTGIAIPTTGNVVPTQQPQPIPALSTRQKDNVINNMQYLDVEQGMLSSGVYFILEDSKGNIWFGTYNGVSRYDGKSFTHFTEKEGLSGHVVLSILEDKSGNIWFGTYDGGVSKYDGKSFTHFTEKEGLSLNYVRTILEDKSGNLWFGTQGGGVSKYDGKSFTHYTVEEGLSHNIVLSILEDKSGNLWFGTGGGGVSKYDGQSFTHYTVEEGLSHNVVMSILEDKSGSLWFGTEGGGVSKYDGKSFTHYTEKEGLSNNVVSSMIRDKSGNIWFGTSYGGVTKYSEKSFTHYTVNKGLSNNVVMSIQEDKSGDIWFGTQGGGVCKYDEKSFTHYTKKEGLCNDVVRSIQEDKSGNIWFGTEGGISKYDGKSFTNYTYKEGLSNNRVMSILEDKSGNLWFGTYGGGVSKYDGKSFIHYTEKEGLSNNSVFSILEDKNGNLWFGTQGGGVSKYDGKSFIHYTEKEGLSHNIVRSITEDNSGNLWIGTEGGGLNKYDGKSFTYFTEKEGLSHNSVFSTIEDKRNNLWISTDYGLNQIVLSEEVGVSSQKGKETTKVSLNINTYENLDGLKGMDFYYNSAILDSKNRIWWGSGKCLTMLDIDKFTSAITPPVVSMNRVEINENFLDYEAKSQLQVDSLRLKVLEGVSYGEVPAFSNYPLNLELPYDRNHLTFYYGAIDWYAPHKIKYSYKIEGLEDNWSETTTDIKADYRNLPYGNYTFKVKAIGQSQEWSEPFEYSFTILPPWWHTWWARTFYGLIALVILVIVIKWRTAKLKQRQKELELEVEVATTEIRSQKEDIEEAHKEITDSINYAERIQRSFLATQESLENNLGEHFVFFKPKDVVSGDFYWADKLDNGDFAVVNADSTGHGVPGAIMSILNISSIEGAIKEGAKTPSEIFNRARTLIIERLKKDGSPEGGKDGMDASIVCFNADKTKMTYTAAQNPIWVIRAGEVIEIKPEKMPVGKHDMDAVPFEGGEFDLQKGDQVYTLTDGFQDQFGGPKGKKFMVKKMREYVLSISHLPMQEQYILIGEVFSNWKGDNEQVDDVCVIGVRI